MKDVTSIAPTYGAGTDWFAGSATTYTPLEVVKIWWALAGESLDGIQIGTFRLPQAAFPWKSGSFEIRLIYDIYIYIICFNMFYVMFQHFEKFQGQTRMWILCFPKCALV